MKRQDLLNVLKKVKPGLASKDIIEQTTSFAFMKDRVVTYNDEISISHPVEDLAIEGVIYAEELYEFLSKAQTDEIEMNVIKDEIQITSGRAHAGLILKKEILLPLEEIAQKCKWKTIPNTFMEGLNFVVFTCSKDNSRPVLRCINVQESGIIESSDGFRITQFMIEENMPVSSFLLPSTSAKELMQYPVTQIGLGQGWAHFKTEDGTIFSCRIYTAEFPNTANHVLQIHDGVEIKFPKTLPDILNRALVFKKQEAGVDKEIKVEIENKKITIKARSATAWFEESTNMQYKGEASNFGINPNFLLDILDKLRICVLSKERTKIRFEGKNWIHVAMLMNPKKKK